MINEAWYNDEQLNVTVDKFIFIFKSCNMHYLIFIFKLFWAESI